MVSVLSLLLLACGDDSGSSNTGGTGGAGGSNGESAFCSGCPPIGANASEESCAAFGVLFGCESAELTGECPDQRVCAVSGCSSVPSFADCLAPLP